MKKGFFKNLGVLVLTSVIAVTASVASPVSVKAEAPSTAKTYNNNKYQIYDQRMTWSEAKAFCENLGGHLATITSAKEQEFIEQLNSSSKRLWIGGHRKEKNDWYWVTGEEWKYTNWDEGEPNDSSNVVSNENCVAVWPKKWNDLNDKNTYEQSGFICEWEGVKTPEVTKIKSAKAKKNKVTVKFKKVADVAGYEVQYSTKKSFKKSKTKTIETKATKVKFKKAKKAKFYYVRVRSYYEGSNGKVYSKWSKVVKTK